MDANKFTDDFLAKTVACATRHGYVNDNFPTVPELSKLASELTLSALQCPEIKQESNGDNDKFYYFVILNVFCFGVFGAHIWHNDFKTFETQGSNLFGAGLNGTVSDALTILTDRDKKKVDPIIKMLQEIYSLFDEHMMLINDVDPKTYQALMFACIIQIYLLGIAVQMKRMGFK